MHRIKKRFLVIKLTLTINYIYFIPLANVLFVWFDSAKCAT